MRDLHQWLVEVGYPDLSIQFNTGRVERFAIGGRNKNGWYIAYRNTLSNGETLDVVGVGDYSKGQDNWSNCDVFKSKADNEIDEATRRRVNEEIKKTQELQEKEREKIQAEVALEAKAIWIGAAPTGQHSYLDRKGISGLFGARIAGDAIIVPCQLNGKIWGLQRINPDGTKRFLTGQRKKGTHFILGRSGGEGRASVQRIIIAEGFATAASLFEALGCGDVSGCEILVIAAFDAGNLLPVAEEIRRRFPDSEIVLAADNDQWGSINVGLDKANAVAEKIGAHVIYPDFHGVSWKDSAAEAGVPAGTGESREPFVVSSTGVHIGRPTDWNDYHRAYGSVACRAEIERQISQLRMAATMGDNVGSGATGRSVDSVGSAGAQDSQGDNGRKIDSVPAGTIDVSKKVRKMAAWELVEAYQHLIDPYFKLYTCENSTMVFRVVDLTKKEIIHCPNWDYVSHEIARVIREKKRETLEPRDLERFLKIWKQHGKKLLSEPRPFTWSDEDLWTYKKLDFKPEAGTYDSWAEFLVRLSSADEFMAFIWSIFEMKNQSRQFLWLYDPAGEGGKSTIIKVLGDIFGNAFTAITNSMVSGAANRWLNGVLYNRRLVAWADCKNPKFCMSEIVRNITSGDNVTVEFKGQAPFSTPMYLKLIVGSNHEPMITSAGADTSRLIRIDVAENVASKNDPDWKLRLRAELPQFLFACREAYERLCKGHGKIELTEETKERVSESADEIESQWDALAYKRFDFNKDYETPSHLFVEFCQELKLQGHDVQHLKEFLKRRHGVKLIRKASEGRPRIYKGLKIMEGRVPSRQMSID